MLLSIQNTEKTAMGARHWICGRIPNRRKNNPQEGTVI